MSLPTFQGRGFLISREGVEVQFSKAGKAYARLPIVFKKQKKVGDSWVTEQETLVEGVVFGSLAEDLAERVTKMQELYVVGEWYLEEYEGKTRAKANIHAAWPVKDDDNRQPVSASRAPAEDSFPF